MSRCDKPARTERAAACGCCALAMSLRRWTRRLEIGHFRLRTKVAERRDDGSQGLQPLDPIRVSGASRRDAGIDCLQFLMNPSIRLYLPQGSYVAPRRQPKTHANRGRCPRLPSSCRSATPENGQTPGVATRRLDNSSVVQGLKPLASALGAQTDHRDERSPTDELNANCSCRPARVREDTR